MEFLVDNVLQLWGLSGRQKPIRIQICSLIPFSYLPQDLKLPFLGYFVRSLLEMSMFNRDHVSSYSLRISWEH